MSSFSSPSTHIFTFLSDNIKCVYTVQSISICSNVSLVDYFICSPLIFPTVSNFEALDFDPLLSDIHCAVTLTLKYKCANPRNVDLDKDYTTNQDNSYVRRPPNKPNWKSDLTHQYQQKLNETDVSGILLALNELTGDIPPQLCTINKLVDEINSVYTSTGSDLGMLKCGQTPNGTKKHRVRTFPHRERFMLNTKINIGD